MYVSRSYRHYPGFRANMKDMKKIANRRIRRQINNPSISIGNNSFYKKMICSYDICDYCSRYSIYDMLYDMQRHIKQNTIYCYNTRNNYMKNYKWK